MTSAPKGSVDVATIRLNVEAGYHRTQKDRRVALLAPVFPVHSTGIRSRPGLFTNTLAPLFDPAQSSRRFMNDSGLERKRLELGGQVDFVVLAKPCVALLVPAFFVPKLEFVSLTDQNCLTTKACKFA